MNSVWDPRTYDSERCRLVPCFDEFYGTVAELVERSCPTSPRILDLGAGTGLLSSAIVARVKAPQIHLLDESAEMLQRAATRLAPWRPEILIQPLAGDLPRGPFDAIVSALTIHHLADDDKRNLYARILNVLTPGGIFINAEQVAGRSTRLQELFEATHLDRARRMGSSEAEIQGAMERMTHDQCATVADQVAWLNEAGFEDSECFFRWFRLAVFGGWRPH